MANNTLVQALYVNFSDNSIHEDLVPFSKFGKLMKQDAENEIQILTYVNVKVMK
ncbi:hypothetical protein [Rossellomorea marisflavi]|uniref:hypothetical protein n=1 Tax=Rossellomorea marisflavi TaxID=189381 RepID=UPI00345D97BA